MDTMILHNEVWNQCKTLIFKKTSKISDHMSRYPDPSDLILLFRPSRSALDCIAEIWALEFLLPGTRTRHQTYDQRERMAAMVRSNRRQGHWKVVEELLLQPQGLYWIERIIANNFSPEDIFGNLVRRLKGVISSMRPDSKARRERELKRRPVRKPVRRRGYRDHGSLSPDVSLGDFSPYIKPELPEEPEVPFLAPKPYQWIPPKKMNYAAGRESTHTSQTETVSWKNEEKSSSSSSSQKTNLFGGR